MDCKKNIYSLRTFLPCNVWIWTHQMVLIIWDATPGRSSLTQLSGRWTTLWRIFSQQTKRDGIQESPWESPTWPEENSKTSISKSCFYTLSTNWDTNWVLIVIYCHKINNILHPKLARNLTLTLQFDVLKLYLTYTDMAIEFFIVNAILSDLTILCRLGVLN